MFAVVKIGASQYLVSEGDELFVQGLQTTDKKLSLNPVLLYSDGANVQVGKPFLTNCQVTAEFLENVKGEKIRVSKYKAKSRYRRTVGFRSQFHRVRIEKISFR